MSRTSTPAGSSTDLDLPRRLASHWRLKLALLVGLTACFCVPYFFLAHNAFFPVRALPLTAPDRWAGFDARWVWAYQSIYLITATLPWLAATRAQLRKYVAGFAPLVAVCFATYLFFPVRSPRPEAAGAASAVGMYVVLLRYDGPYNAFPSLHAGLLYYTLAFAARVYGRRVTAGAAIVFGAWSALILWATLATKQHYAVDLLAGIALAAACDAAAWRRRRPSDAEKSHAGLR